MPRETRAEAEKTYVFRVPYVQVAYKTVTTRADRIEQATSNMLAAMLDAGLEVRPGWEVQETVEHEDVVTKRFDFVMESGETAEEVFSEMIGESSVTLRMVCRSGSSGHPVGEVSGSLEEVNGFLTRHNYPLFEDPIY